MAFKDEFGNLGQRFDEFAARLEERTRSRPGKGAGNGGLDLRSILGTLRDLLRETSRARGSGTSSKEIPGTYFASTLTRSTLSHSGLCPGTNATREWHGRSLSQRPID